MDRLPNQLQGAQPAPAAAVQELRVLYVDDEPALARLAARALPLHGIAVDVFTDPEIAATAYEAEPARFDVVVTDHAMRTLTGLQLVERLRRTTPALPAILTSGYLTAAQRADAAEHGIDRFLQKPVTIAELVSAVTAVCGR